MSILSFLSDMFFEHEPVEEFTVTVNGQPQSVVKATDFEVKEIADRHAASSREVVVRDRSNEMRYLFREVSDRDRGNE